MATAFRTAGWTEMKSRAPIWEIAERVGRDPDEVAILIMDRVRKRFLRSRPGEDATRYFYQRIARHEKKGDAK